MKLGEERYWQVGDEVFLFNKGKDKIKAINYLCDYNIETYKNFRFSSDKGIEYPIKASNRQTVFHLGAITFDEQDRPISINYDYVPEREPKVMVTKLPHEFVSGEKVLVRDYKGTAWFETVYESFNNKIFVYTHNTFKYTAKYCIPFKGNQHCLGNVTHCESGKIPDDYIFPEQEHEFKPFDRVLMRNFEDRRWYTDIFRFLDTGEYPYQGMSGNYKYCIPYEGNEKLLGTTDSPEE